jgi:hypothetical protein
MRTKEGIEASAATYRKATNQVAKKLKVDPEHTKYPSDDFKEIVKLIPEKIRNKALKWYKMGIKRGLTEATDMMADGKIYKKGNTVYCPGSIDINVKTKFKGEDWVKRSYKFTATHIGFE